MSSVNGSPNDSLNSSQLAWMKKMGAVLSIAFHIATPQGATSSSVLGSVSSQKRSEIFSSAQTATEEPACSAQAASLPSKLQAASNNGLAAPNGKRVIPGGGGYVFEQHADGKIFIVQSPKHGKCRIEVKDSKGYNAILAKIGVFPEETHGDAPQFLGGVETETEKKLAEFTQAMSGIVVNVDKQPVSVRPPYHINAGTSLDAVKKNRAGNPKVGKLINEVFAGQDGHGATIGKATPEQMQKFLQKSVDQGFAKDTSSKGLREFLDTYGISTDCSGLAVQALNFLADGDMQRGDKEAINALAVNTDVLATYEKVSAPFKLQPGDMMVKPGEYEAYIDPKDNKEKKKRVKVGHVRIITDVDEQDNSVYFTTLESTGDDNIISKGGGDGIGQRRWRILNANKFENLETQDGEKFKAATKADSSYIFTRYK